METNRLLFVDDEATLRLTFPLVLKLHGFEVRTAGSVAEALLEITTHPFDILVSDLNIGEAGDGFTVVSAMRRTQPNCVNFILTGYPAFESALAAIQSQVDDYLIKPAKTEELVEMIQEKLRVRSPRHSSTPMRLATLIRGTVGEILDRTLCRMRADPTLGPVRMSDRERIDNLQLTIIEIANQLDSPEPDQLTAFAIQSSREHGVRRLSVGYDIAMLVTETAMMGGVVYDIAREHLLLSVQSWVTGLSPYLPCRPLGR
jgi:ActR/RegA family two-component response regulator